MTIQKKKLPLMTLEALEPFWFKKSDLFKIDNDDENLMRFVDNDIDSDFFFQIEKTKVESSKLQILICVKPQNKLSVEAQRTWIDGTLLDQCLKNWEAILKGYSTVKVNNEDPIENKYFDEFYSEFTIIDPDAEDVSFDLDQQLFLDKYLDKLLLVINQHNPEGKDSELNKISDQAISLKNDLTHLTKKEVIESLSRIWAKVRRFGLNILKEVYVEFKKELIKQLIQGQLG